MNKKNTKVLSGVLATTLGLGSVMGATTVLAKTVDELYSAAFTATQEAQNKKTQEAINVARKAVRELEVALKDKKDLKDQLIGTLSGMLDPLQQKQFVDFYGILYKEDKVTLKETISQDEINKARAYIDGFNGAEENKEYVPTWSDAVDKFQQANINTTSNLVKKALETKTTEDVKAARKALNDLLKSTNKDTKEFAQGLDTQLAEVEKTLEEAAKVLTLKSFEVVGARTVKATFNKPVEDTAKLALTLRRDDVKVSIKETVWNEDKTVATITSAYDLQDGKYSLESVYDKEAATKVEGVEVKSASLTKITFLSEVAIVTGKETTVDSNYNKPNQVKTNIRIQNQYGEDITKKADSSNINVSTSIGKASFKDGVITIDGNGSYFSVGQEIIVTVIDKETATVVTQKLKVVQSAEVKEIKLGEIVTEHKDYKGKDMTVASMTNGKVEYYMPITVIDQYGNELTAEQIKNCNLVVISSNEQIIKFADSTGKVSIVERNKKPAVLLQNGDKKTQTFGNVIVTVVAVNGVTQSLKTEVKENGKVDSFKLYQPETVLKAGVEKTVPFEAINQYGNSLTTIDDFKNVEKKGDTLQFGLDSNKTTVTINGGTIDYKVDYNNKKKVSIVITPSSTAKNVTLIVVTNTGKVQNVTWKVSAESIPTTIESAFDGDFYTKMQVGQTQELSSYLYFDDQYGDYMGYSRNGREIYDSNDDLVKGYSFEITPVDANNNVAYKDGVFTSKTSGISKFKVSLKKDTSVIDTHEFIMEAVDAKEIKSFEINKLNKQYVGEKTDKDTLHNQKVTISGVVDDEYVQIDQKLLTNVSVAGFKMDGVSILANGEGPTTSGKDAKTTVTAVVDNGVKTFVLTKELVYSDAAPTVTGMDVYYGWSKIADPVISLHTDALKKIGNVKNQEKSEFSFRALDQYNKLCGKVQFFVSSINKENSDFNVAIEKETGKITISGTGDLRGKSFTINAISESGISKSIEVVLTGGTATVQ